MSSSCRKPLALALLAALAAAAPVGAAETPAAKPILSVCADPANLPYSDEKQEGFENRIAALFATAFCAAAPVFASSSDPSTTSSFSKTTATEGMNFAPALA